MAYLVFSQVLLAQDALFQLVNNARQHFRAELEITERLHLGPHSARLTLVLTLPQRAPVSFAVAVRPSAEADQRRAAEAARLGRAGGMDALARRCQEVWQFTPQGDEYTEHMLSALLASALLGPVMPPDGSTLYGVRGARERAERLS